MLNFISKKELNILRNELQLVKTENEKIKKDMRILQEILEKTMEERFDYLFNKIYEIKESAEKAAKVTSMEMISTEFAKEKFRLIEFESKLMKRVLKIDTK